MVLAVQVPSHCGYGSANQAAVYHPCHGADLLSGCRGITAALCCLCWGTQGAVKCPLALGCLPLTWHLCC